MENINDNELDAWLDEGHVFDRLCFIGDIMTVLIRTKIFRIKRINIISSDLILLYKRPEYNVYYYETSDDLAIKFI